MAMTPPAASDWPWPVRIEPPEEEPVTSVAARIVADSIASTVTLPALSGVLRSARLDVAPDVVEDDRGADAHRVRSS